MHELQVREIFEILHISNKFDPSIKPFKITRKRTFNELKELLNSYEYKQFRKNYPHLSRGVENFFEENI